MHKVTFSGQNVDISRFALHHLDIEDSLRYYFGNARSFAGRFATDGDSDVRRELAERLAETDLASALTVLSAIEAAFRIDYLQRCYRKEKDPLSRALRDIYKRKNVRAKLETEILEAWKDHTLGASSLIGDLRGALRFRHWLAHGRYWTPKLGQRYDFVSVYSLASNVLTNFPLFRP